jgi:hypothetical protein
VRSGGQSPEEKAQDPGVERAADGALPDAAVTAETSPAEHPTERRHRRRQRQGR